MFFSSSQKENKLYLLIEIQSGLVRGSLVAEKTGEPISVIYVKNEKTPTPEEVSGDNLLKTIIKSIESIFSSIMKEGIEVAVSQGFNRKSLKNVHFILSSPWIISESKTVIMKFEKETKVIEDMFKKIIEDESEALSNKYGIKESENIEKKIFEIRLNGYIVNHFEERKAKELQLSFATSVGAKSFLDQMRAISYPLNHSLKNIYHSALLLQYNALRSLPIIGNGYIYIHVHDELTDIVIIKNGVCVNLASFPFGINTFIRNFSKSSSHASESSNSILKMYGKGDLHVDETIKIGNESSKVIAPWKNSFFEIIANTSDIGLVPRTVYMSVHSHFDIFRDAIIMENKFNFEIISYDDIPVQSGVKFLKESEKSRMVEMYVLALKNML